MNVPELLCRQTTEKKLYLPVSLLHGTNVLCCTVLTGRRGRRQCLKALQKINDLHCTVQVQYESAICLGRAFSTVNCNAVL